MGNILTWTTLAVVLSAGVTEHSYGWTPGVGNESATSGFTVDRQSRTDVVSFWHAVYKQSEGYEDRINWTGLSGGPGTTSSAFKGDVQRRINYFRAMAGMDADMGMNTGSTVKINSQTPSGARPSSNTDKGTAAQYAAYMLTVNSNAYRPGGSVSTGSANPHNPPQSWEWDGPVARNGAFYSNLAAGVYGPGAIDSYMMEDDQAAAGRTNHEVAHRRLLLYSRRAEFATGDVTQTPSGNNPYFSANALYSSGNLRSTPEPEFVPCPGDGFFPETISTRYWSLSYPGADFSSATVSMTHASSGAVVLSVVSRSANFGDKTLVWEPAAGQIASALDQDQTYQVNVSNILIGGVAQSFSYSVTLINPDRLNESLELTAESDPGSDGLRCYFDPVEHAEGYRLQVARKSEGLWREGAEDATSSLVLDGTEGDYSFRSTEAAKLGLKGFHIGLTNDNFRYQYVELDRQIIPSDNSVLEFEYRRRRMGGHTRARVEISSDDGANWQELWGMQGNRNYDDSFSPAALPLGEYAGRIIRLRFSVRRPDEAATSYWPVDHPEWGVYNGVNFDAIRVTGSDLELVGVEESDYPANAGWVLWDGGIAGETYTLRLRAKLGGNWMPYGVPLEIGSSSTDELVLSDLSENFSPEGGQHTLDVSSNLDWSWSTDVNWITSTEALNQSGDRKFTYHVLSNDGSVSERAGTISWSSGGITRVHTVYQSGSVVITQPAEMPLPLGSTPVSASDANAGKYGGFLALPDGETAGYFKTFKLTNTGKFSAKLYWGGTLYSVKGVFDESGYYSSVVSSSGGSPATVNLQLTRTDAGGFKVEGDVTVSGQTAQVLLVKSGSTPSLSGSYTLLVLGDDDEEANGYGLMTVTSSGTAKITGVLGNGVKWTAKCFVSADGEMPIYYSKSGSLAGLLCFRDIAGVSDCDAQVEWRKSANAQPLIRNLIGSKFVNTGGRLLSDVSDTNANVEMVTGSGGDEEFWSLEWTSSNLLNYAGPEKLKLKVKATNGHIKGKLPSGGSTWKAEGVIFQKQNLAAGLIYIPRGETRRLVIVPNE